jgi:hypothetical protein
MTRLFTSFLFVACSIISIAQIQPTQFPAITFENPIHDFGDIFQGDKVEHTFKFANTGKAPLIITNVQVTCGCTTPKGWPRDPIAVGEKVELTVAFNSTGKLGKQNKVVTIISNASGSNTVTFTANVLEKTLANN